MATATKRDEAESDFMAWHDLFAIALDGAVASPSPAKDAVRFAAQIADEALIEIHKRRKVVDET